MINDGGKCFLVLKNHVTAHCRPSAYVKVHGEVGWWTYRPRKGKVRVGLLGQPDDNQEDNEEVEEIQVWPYERRIIK